MTPKTDKLMKRMTERRKKLEDLKSLLASCDVDYDILSHNETLRSAEDGVEQGLGALRDMAPTFILKTENGFMAAIISGETRICYKKIKKLFGLKNVALAKPEQVKEITGAEVGYVSLINPGLPTIIDNRLAELDIVFGGCGVPQMSLRIHAADLIRITGAKVFDFAEQKQA
jgi:prolyl-tRNA editing enzyme YbaK/EbsC (Cys-tRNA(Pro) deacylase)